MVDMIRYPNSRTDRRSVLWLLGATGVGLAGSLLAHGNVRVPKEIAGFPDVEPAGNTPSAGTKPASYVFASDPRAGSDGYSVLPG